MEELNALRQTLRERLLECYEEAKEDWIVKDPLDLLSLADIIHASQVVVDYLPDAIPDEDIRYLLGFENPLEVASDYLFSVKFDAVSNDDLRSVVQYLRNMEESDHNYPRTEPPSEPQITM